MDSSDAGVKNLNFNGGRKKGKNNKNISKEDEYYQSIVEAKTQQGFGAKGLSNKKPIKQAKKPKKQKKPKKKANKY